jgi:VanZ family protein
MLEKIFKLMEIPRDKANHLIYGLLIFIIVNLTFGNPLLSMIICTLIAILKEVYDHYHPDHNWSTSDILYTVMGGLLGLTLIL